MRGVANSSLFLYCIIVALSFFVKSIYFREALFMTKRLLDCNSSDIINMSKKDILEAIAASEGRVIVTETIGAVQPTLYSISNAELACAFGADILLLNLFDVYEPTFYGIPKVSDNEIIKEIKRLTGRIVGINLEPVDVNEQTIGEVHPISSGRMANKDTAIMAKKMGADMIVLTGNPGTGVSNNAIINSLKEIHKILKDEIILAAGKMHAAGSLKESGENIIKKEDVKEFAEAGYVGIAIPENIMDYSIAIKGKRHTYTRMARSINR